MNIRIQLHQIYSYDNQILLVRSTAWKNSNRKHNPWSRTGSARKVWDRRPTEERYRQLEEEEDGVRKYHEDGGMRYYYYTCVVLKSL